MAVEIGTASNYRDCLDKLRLFLTTNADLVSAGEEWEELRWDTTSTTQELILKGPGLSGDDEIFIGFRSYESIPSDYFNWDLNGFTGYDPAKTFFQQPVSKGTASGAVLHLNLWNSDIPYWFVANGRRVIIVVRINTRYFTAYVGLLTPYFTPQQEAYPLAIIGNNTGVGTQRWSDVSPNSTLELYCCNGANWSSVTSFPSLDNTGSRPLIQPTEDNTYVLIPFILYTGGGFNTGADAYVGRYYGDPDGLHYVSGFSNVSENIVDNSGVEHLVVQTGGDTTLRSYHAIRLE